MEHALRRGDLDPDPLTQFQRWLTAAREDAAGEATAMVLATRDADGQPSARVVLLKGVDERGFVFFTNYESRKARQLAAAPRAALLFHWERPEVEWQVRVEGPVTLVTEAESDAYFASRSRESRIGAWASHQSAVLKDRETLVSRVDEVTARFAGGEVTRPARWGGYRLVPQRMELWQGGAHRLHDRFQYLREGDGWRMERLSP